MFVFTQPLPVSTCHVRRETISRIREHAEGSKPQRLPNNFCFWSQVCSVLGRFERQGIETCSLSRNAHRWFFPATFPRHWRELLRAKIRRIIIKFYRGKSDQRKSHCIKGYVIKVIYFPVYSRSTFRACGRACHCAPVAAPESVVVDSAAHSDSRFHSPEQLSSRPLFSSSALTYPSVQ